jgi:hypothetical protein
MIKSCASMLSLLFFISLVGCGSEPVAKPETFEQWNAKDGTFRIEYPSDWEAKGGGKNSIQWARFTKGNAEIYVNVKFSDSALADVMGAGGGMMSGALGVDDVDMPSPVAAIHEAKKEEVAQDFSNYTEGEAEVIRPFLGEGRRSEFTATKGLVQVKGYRATILSNDRGVTVTCRCAESDWPALQAAFAMILEKMTRGSKQI